MGDGDAEAAGIVGPGCRGVVGSPVAVRLRAGDPHVRRKLARGGALGQQLVARVEEVVARGKSARIDGVLDLPPIDVGAAAVDGEPDHADQHQDHECDENDRLAALGVVPPLLSQASDAISTQFCKQHIHSISRGVRRPGTVR